jgi:hypothetical protein
MASDEIIKTALESACILSNKEFTNELLTVWKIGLSERSDEDVKEAIINFCKQKNDNYMVTPAQFMEFKQNPYFYL